MDRNNLRNFSNSLTNFVQYIDQNEEQIINLGNIAQTLTRIEGSLTAIQANVNDMRGEINGMRGELNGMRGEINDMRGELNGMRGEINGMRGELNGTRGEIKQMRGNLAEVIMEIISLNARSVIRVSNSHLHTADSVINWIPVIYAYLNRQF